MEERKNSRCYAVAFAFVAVAIAFYVFEAVVMLINSAEVGVFSELLILSVVVGVAALALAVLSLTVFKSKRKIKVLFLILAAVLIFLAAMGAVYGYGEKGGPEWLIKHDLGGFTFDAAVGAVALIVAFVIMIVVTIVATAEVRAEKRVINKQKRAEKRLELAAIKEKNAAEAEEKRKLREEEKARLAEEKRIEAEKLAEERKIAAESRAEEKRLSELKAAEEKAVRDREKAAKKAVSAEVAATSIATTAQTDFTIDDSRPETAVDVLSEKAERKLKIYPFVLAGISLIVTLMFTFVRWSGDETVAKIKFFLFSAVCYQWVLFGIHILRNVKGGLRYLGILAILFAPIGYAMLAVKNTDETRFFVNTIICLVPYNGNKFMLGYLIDTIFGSVAAYATWEYYAAGMAISVWFGTLVYFLVPSKGKLSGALGKDGWVRYFACAFMTALVGVVLVAIVVALVIMIIVGLFGTSSSTSSSHSSGSSGSAGDSSGSDEATEEDDRFNKTIVLGDLRSVGINGDTVTDLNSGREYRIYNYHSNTGYFEDENRNVYYHSSNGEVIVTGEHRGYSESEYEADNRIRDEVGFTR